MTPPTALQLIRQELEKILAAQLVPLLDQRDGAVKLVQELPRIYSASDVSIPQPPQGGAQRAWELCGLYFLNQGRLNDTLPLFERLYFHMLEWQDLEGKRCHKAMPLVWIAECHSGLGHPAIARRFLMLTLCEDAISLNGTVPADQSGIYFRLVWNEGIPDAAVQKYAQRAYQTWKKNKKDSRYPEWVLQEGQRGLA